MATNKVSIDNIIRSEAASGSINLGGLAGLLERKLETLKAGRPIYEANPACPACLDTGWVSHSDGRGVLACRECRKPKTTDPNVSAVTGTVKAFKRA